MHTRRIEHISKLARCYPKLFVMLQSCEIDYININDLFSYVNMSRKYLFRGQACLPEGNPATQPDGIVAGFSCKIGPHAGSVACLWKIMLHFCLFMLLNLVDNS